MRLGVHVPIAEGFVEAVERATRLGCTTMQIFSRSPRGGSASTLSSELVERFDRARRDAGIEPLAVHSPYIINLASPVSWMWKQSVALYRQEYARATALKAQYLVTHVGSHRGEGEAAGLSRVAEALSQTLDGLSSTVTILLENTAGSGQGLGYQFEHLAIIRNAVNDTSRVGICLDTAHLFAAGYPLHTREGLDQVVASFDRVVGLSCLQLIHLNDSKVPFGSRVDRHWHIGQGQIGLEAFRRIVNHPALHEIPLILETPKKTEREDRRNLATVRALVPHRGTPATTRHASRRTRTVHT